MMSALLTPAIALHARGAVSEEELAALISSQPRHMVQSALYTMLHSDSNVM
jgi:hypothetical protein